MNHAFERLLKQVEDAGVIDRGARSRREWQACVARRILGFPDDAAEDKAIADLFVEGYTPGTFVIGEIKNNPGFLCARTGIGYEDWVRREVRQDIQAMSKAGVLPESLSATSSIEEDLLEILEHELEDGQRFADQITLQEYTDIFRRVILALLYGDPEREINTFGQLNAIGGAIAIALLPQLAGWPLRDLLKVSLAAGLIGLNLKTAAAAVSVIHQQGIIPIYPKETPQRQLATVMSRLTGKVREAMAIDYWEDYERRVLVPTAGSRLLFFTDDYIETIFDLKLIESQLDYNSNLTVCVIPRARRYGNDASYEDVLTLLEEPVFLRLKSYQASGRMEVCPNGPRLGTVNGRKISRDVADRLKSCDSAVVKGARAYEMLQGIRKPVYFGFAVCREISEAVTGIDAETGHLVFICQRSSQPTFFGFRERRMRPHEFRPGRQSFLCRVTARDTYEQYLLPSFYRDLCKVGHRAVREGTVEIVPFLDDLDQDRRRGLTLIVRPSPEVMQQLEAVNERLRRVAPRHFFYEPSRFHFTIISLVTAHDSFDVNDISLGLCERTIREVLCAFPPYEVEFVGVGPTRNSIIAKGFPVNGTLEAIRDVLRDRLGAAGLGRGVDERYRSRGAHITLARFKVVGDLSLLIPCLDELCEAPLGRMRVQAAQLVVNDFYLSPDKVKVVAEVALTGK